MAKLRPRPAPLALSIALSLIVGGISLWGPLAASRAAAPDHPLVARAFEDLGTYQGECWPWVRQVVADSLGLRMGFDYRQGFFDAGAVEVHLAEAAPGDVIQLADDSYTNPDADYPGLHTAIIVSVEGPGTFEVIDSNSQWDGIVRTRSGYDPVENAARYTHISFHVYRFPSPETGPDATGTVEAGEVATVVAPGDCLNLRSEPRVAAGNIVICLPDGMRVRLLGPLESADGYDWLKVESPLGIGWVASAFVSTAGGGGLEEVQSDPPLHRTFVGAVAANAGKAEASPVD